MLVVTSNTGTDDHDTGPHVERPARTRAARDGLIEAGIFEAVIEVAERAATPEELHRVHTPRYLAWLEEFCASGGGRIDSDTRASRGSWPTALHSAGAGLAAVEAVGEGVADVALVLTRPPGHHARAEQAMGFCLLNNIAVTAAALIERGEKVAVVDWDVHHGNGTQELFWDDPRVLYMSVHEHGLFPETGRVVEVGGPNAVGTNLNVPLPPGAGGETIRRVIDVLVAPAMAAFAPTWVLVSAGFDGHRADPIADWLLTAGDYGDLTARLRALTDVPSVLFLEGGYDLDALRLSVGATAAALVGSSYRPEPLSTGSIGRDDVDKIATWRSHQEWFATGQ